MWRVDLLFISYIDLAPTCLLPPTTDPLSLIPAFNNQSYIARWEAKSNSAAGSMASMFPDEMGIGEEDKTVQLVLIYGSIAILYLAVAYIMFFRSFLSGQEFSFHPFF